MCPVRRLRFVRRGLWLRLHVPAQRQRSRKSSTTGMPLRGFINPQRSRGGLRLWKAYSKVLVRTCGRHVTTGLTGNGARADTNENLWGCPLCIRGRMQGRKRQHNPQGSGEFHLLTTGRTSISCQRPGPGRLPFGSHDRCLWKQLPVGSWKCVTQGACLLRVTAVWGRHLPAMCHTLPHSWEHRHGYTDWGHKGNTELDSPS